MFGRQVGKRVVQCLCLCLCLRLRYKHTFNRIFLILLRLRCTGIIKAGGGGGGGGWWWRHGYQWCHHGDARLAASKFGIKFKAEA